MTLTRQEMEDVIKGGGSVLHDGTVYSSVDTLPDESVFAGNDETRKQAARDAIDQQLATLTAQRAKLDQQPVVDTPATDTSAESGKKKAASGDSGTSTT